MNSERLKQLALMGDRTAEREWWRWLDRRAERCAWAEGECVVALEVLTSAEGSRGWLTADQLWAHTVARADE